MSDIDTTPYRRAVLEATDEMICDVVALVRHAQAEHYADSLTHVLEAYAAMVELLGLDDFSEDDDGESIPPASFSAEEIEGVTEATAQALTAKPRVEDDEAAEPLALYFTPDAIRDHFEADDDEIGRAIVAASDEQLRKIGQWCIGADTLYSEFHRLLVDGAMEVLGVDDDA